MKIKGTVLGMLLTADMANAGCGAEAHPCFLAGGSYHLVLPEGAGPFPAVIFLHGHGSSGEGTLRNVGMVSALTARGYAVVAPDGQPMAGRNGRSWNFQPNRPAGRDEVGFILAVADDASCRSAVSATALPCGAMLDGWA